MLFIYVLILKVIVYLHNPGGVVNFYVICKNYNVIFKHSFYVMYLENKSNYLNIFVYSCLWCFFNVKIYKAVAGITQKFYASKECRVKIFLHQKQYAHFVFFLNLGPLYFMDDLQAVVLLVSKLIIFIKTISFFCLPPMETILFPAFNLA